MKTMLILFVLTGFSSFSQTEMYAGGAAAYLFNGKVQFIEGLVDVSNEFAGDASIGFITNDKFGFELNYSGAYNTGLEFRSYSFTDHEDFYTTLDIHSISFNYLNYFAIDGPLTPFVSIGSGISIFNVRKDGADDPVRFALNFGGGAMIKVNRFMTARMRVRYFAPLIFEGTGIHGGIGTGGSYIGMSIDASAPLAQLNASAGFIFNLN